MSADEQEQEQEKAAGSEPSLIHVQAEPVLATEEFSGNTNIISVKARDLSKIQRAPLAVAQPLDFAEHYGHVAIEDRDMDELGEHEGAEGGLIPTGRGRHHHRHGLQDGVHFRNSVVPGAENGTELTMREQALFEVFRTARCLRQACLFNLVLVGITALYLTEYAVVLVFPLLGYFGCKYYRYWMLLVYLTYCILEAVAGVVACVLQDSVSFTAIRCFFILFNIACARYAVQLCQCVRVFQEGDALFLQTSQLLKEVERGTLC